LLSFILLTLVSCNAAVLEGIVAGMNNASNAMMYGGAMYGGGSSMYSGVPYSLSPDVAVEQATQVINNNVKQYIEEEQRQTKRVQENLNNQMSNFWDNVSVSSDVAPVVPVYDVNNISTQNMTNQGSTTNSAVTSRSGTTCYLCHGLKKCWTCNGNRTYLVYGKYVKCPNCTDGLCSHCHGSGLK